MGWDWVAFARVCFFFLHALSLLRGRADLGMGLGMLCVVDWLSSTVVVYFGFCVSAVGDVRICGGGDR